LEINVWVSPKLLILVSAPNLAAETIESDKVYGVIRVSGKVKRCGVKNSQAPSYM